MRPPHFLVWLAGFVVWLVAFWLVVVWLVDFWLVDFWQKVALAAKLCLQTREKHRIMVTSANRF